MLTENKNSFDGLPEMGFRSNLNSELRRRRGCAVVSRSEIDSQSPFNRLCWYYSVKVLLLFIIQSNLCKEKLNEQELDLICDYMQFFGVSQTTASRFPARKYISL